jgi:hypothetical protein
VLCNGNSLRTLRTTEGHMAKGIEQDKKNNKKKLTTKEKQEKKKEKVAKKG